VAGVAPPFPLPWSAACRWLWATGSGPVSLHRRYLQIADLSWRHCCHLMRASVRAPISPSSICRCGVDLLDLRPRVLVVNWQSPRPGRSTNRPHFDVVLIRRQCQRGRRILHWNVPLRRPLLRISPIHVGPAIPPSVALRQDSCVKGVVAGPPQSTRYRRTAATSCRT
jgi:hypothetical protein